MEDNGQLAFAVSFEMDTFKKQSGEIIKMFEKIGQSAKDEGLYISEFFSKESLRLKVDFDTPDDKIQHLNALIEEVKAKYASVTQEADRYKKAAYEAFSNGDNAKFQQQTDFYVDAQTELAKLTERMGDYQHMLDELESTSGRGAGQSVAASLFMSEEDYNRTKEIADELRNLYAELDSKKDNATEAAAVRTRIKELSEEAMALRKNATEAAAALGESMGARAAALSTTLYELNTKLTEQQQIYDKLTTRYQRVGEMLKRASETDNAAVINYLSGEYTRLAEQVENAGNALASTKAKQKDASKAWEEMQDKIASLGDDLGETVVPLNNAVRGFTQLSRVLTTSKNPVTIFRAALGATRGTMNLTRVSVKQLITALKALWAAMLKNPLTLIIVAIVALVAALAKFATFFKSVAQKQAQLNEAEKASIELQQQQIELLDRKSKAIIKSKEQELEAMKAANASLEEQRKKEKEIADLRVKNARETFRQNGQYVDDIDKNTAALQRQQKALAALQKRSNEGGDMTWRQVNSEMSSQGVEYRRSGFLGWGRKSLYVDGIRVSKGSVDDMMKDVQGQLDNTNKKLEIGIKTKDDLSDSLYQQSLIRIQQQQEKIQEAWRSRREQQNTKSDRIALINDQYEREVAAAKAANEKIITSLKERLDTDNKLTSTERDALNQQIYLKQQKLNKDLETLAEQHRQKIQALQRQTEDISEDSSPKTAEQRLASLSREYVRKQEDIQNRLNLAKSNGSLSKEEEAELERQKLAYAKRYLAEEVILNRQLEQEKYQAEINGINLRIAAAENGSMEEYRLKLELIEKQRQAEIAANKGLAEDMMQSEDEINAKYQAQKQQMLDSLLQQYAGYYAQILEQERKYASDRAKLEAELSTASDPAVQKKIKDAIATLEKQHKKTTLELKKSLVKETLGDVFDEATYENVKQALASLKELEGMSFEEFQLSPYGSDNATEEDWREFQEVLKKVKKELWDMGKGAYTVKDAIDGLFSGKHDDMERSLDYITSKLGDAANVCSTLATAMREFGEAAKNTTMTDLADMMDMLSEMADKASTYASMGSKFGGYGAAIGAAFGVLLTVFTKNAERKTEVAQERKDRAENGRDYLDEITNGISNILSSLGTLNDTITSLNFTEYRKQLLAAIGDMKSDTYDSKEFYKSLTDYFANSNVSDTYRLLGDEGLPAIGKAITESVSDIAQKQIKERYGDENGNIDYARLAREYLSGKAKFGLQDEFSISQNYTKHLAAYLNWQKSELEKRKTELIKEMNDLFASGDLDPLKYFNLNQRSRAFNIEEMEYSLSMLKEGSKEYEELLAKINNAKLEMSDAFKELWAGLTGTDIKSMAEQWASIFQEMGDDTTSALEKINESIDELVANMIKQFTIIGPLTQRLTKYMEEWADQNAAAYGMTQNADGTWNWNEAALIALTQGMKGIAAESTSLYTDYRNALAANGIDLSSAASRSANQTGIAQASQESIDELNGRMTAIQGHTSYIPTIADNTAIVRDTVTAIHRSVLSIEGYTAHLVAIDSNITQLRTDVANIRTNTAAFASA